MEIKGMRIVVAGASGLVGSALVPLLKAEGAEVTRLVRSAAAASGEIEWHPDRGSIDAPALGGFDAIINLAGDGIADGRWTEEKKRRILDSRVNGTRLLSETMAKVSRKPAAFINASAIGFYGSRGDELVDEESGPGEGFLASVCRQWESATAPAEQAGIRVVKLRFGVILTKDGGIMGSMLRPFKLGLGGKVGSGKQVISWVAMDDVVAAINFILHDESLRGPINVVAPRPVTNEEFTKTLGRVLSRPTFMAMPAFAARLAFGEMADEMMLSSTRVAGKVLNDAGFEFQYPELEGAVRAMLG
ncbi:MAG TPA: TIGR01777 family oxidoreductase [Pyrinomonadaceae bacterium]|nr:TIGR01777 family oxidoreductase [Pyrinomonadaceae bacterium]